MVYNAGLARKIEFGAGVLVILPSVLVCILFFPGPQSMSVGCSAQPLMLWPTRGRVGSDGGEKPSRPSTKGYLLAGESSRQNLWFRFIGHSVSLSPLSHPLLFYFFSFFSLFLFLSTSCVIVVAVMDVYGGSKQHLRRMCICGYQTMTGEKEDGKEKNFG